MNAFGKNFRITVFGESHGPAIGVVLDGVPAGMPLSEADFEADLARRRSGAKGTTPRRESDTPRIVSGAYRGHTTGAPLAILFRNEDARSDDYAATTDHPRPSHADLTAAQKFHGHNDPRGGGHFSGRLTLTLVAAGVVAKKILAARDNAIRRDVHSDPAPSGNNPASGNPAPPIRISSEIVEIGGSRDKTLFEATIAGAAKEGDSVGGVIECRAAGVPTGLGEPFFDSVESVLSHLMFSIPGVKGVEFGSGFAGAALKGSQNNDAIIDALGTTATNNAGGIVGGITGGGDIVVRIAVKPTASIAKPQATYNFASGEIEPLTIRGRHDTCIALRAAVVAEAALAIVLADLIRH